MEKKESASKPKEKKPDGRKNNPNIGRPKIECTPELSAKICLAIATTSCSIKKICADNPDFPKHTTIYEWIGYNKEFADLYLEAKQKQVLVHMEETYDIAEDSNRDYLEGKDGNSIINGEWVARSKLRIELRKWQAARLMPRLFGDKVQNETTVTIIPHEERLKLLDD